MLVYVNGHFLPKEEATVSVFDHGFLYGDGIYETLRSYGGRIFLLQKHLSRLRQSADAVSLALPLPAEKIGEALRESITVNKLQDAYLRLHISRGPGEIGLDPSLCPAPTMIIVAKPFHDYPRELFENGVSVSVVQTRRNHPLALPPSVKSTNFLNNILAKIESLRAGAYEGILLNWKGYVAEGTISNIFAVKKGTLLTPSLDCGILEGVTRDLVLHLARTAGIKTRELQMRLRELQNADECFITNSTIEIMPVTSVDRHAVGGGVPGDITKALMQAYRSEVRRHV